MQPCSGKFEQSRARGRHVPQIQRMNRVMSIPVGSNRAQMFKKHGSSTNACGHVQCDTDSAASPVHRQGGRHLHGDTDTHPLV